MLVTRLTCGNYVILVVLDSAGSVERALRPEAADDHQDRDEEHRAGDTQGNDHRDSANTWGVQEKKGVSDSKYKKRIILIYTTVPRTREKELAPIIVIL